MTHLLASVGSKRLLRSGLVSLVLLGAPAIPAFAEPLSPDDAAAQILNTARHAYNEQKFDVATERFREFLKSYGGNKQAAAAQYGLGLSLLEVPTKDYPKIIEALSAAAGNAEFADRAYAQYYLGATNRAMGNDELAKQGDINQRKAASNQRFEEAARQFGAAGTSFAARLKAAAGAATKPAPTTPVPAAAAVPADAEWSARARCDQVEMLLRLDKAKEAHDIAASLVSDATLLKSRFRPLALYHLGYSSFVLRDYLAAGRALSQLAPFQQDFGLHARYLLARTHHLSNERPEAALQYKAVLTAYDDQKKAADLALKNPDSLKDKPEQRAIFEGLVRNPAPDYVVRAYFYNTVLLYEENKINDAADQLVIFVQQNQKSPLLQEAQLRLGLCQVQLGKYQDALNTLTPLREHPEFGDQAMWWHARARLGIADQNNPDQVAQASREAIDEMKKAADKANASKDPSAKARRGDILLDLADNLSLNKQSKEAAALYHQVVTENANPDRNEEATQREVTALHLAGQYKESDELAKKFEATYPKSTLLPAVLFRSAENVYLQTVSSANTPKTLTSEQLNAMYEDAIKRYQRVIEKYPEFPYISMAKQGVALCDYKLGRIPQAIAVMETIPEADRFGDLATVPYLFADCLLRTLPTDAEATDGLTSGRLCETAAQAAKLLETYLAVIPNVDLNLQAKNPNWPDAMLKLSHTYVRLATQMANPEDRKKNLQSARETLDRFGQLYPKDPGMALATFERAKVMALANDVGGAINELNKFQADPFRSSPIAPLAILRLSTLQRAQNKPADAVKALEQMRQQEAALLKDPARADLVPLLQYEHGVALKEAGKLPEARAIFDAMVKNFAGKPEGLNAVWRSAQCRREEAMAQVVAARKTLVKGGRTSEETANATKALADAGKAIRELPEQLLAQAQQLGPKAASTEPNLRLLYEAAWCYRVLSESEIEAARQQLQTDAVARLKAKLSNEKPAGQIPAPTKGPDLASAALPLQPSEQKARDQYKAIIAAAPDSSLANQARLELAEVLADRNEVDPAIDLLAAAMDKDPSPELAEKLRCRLAACHLVKGNAKIALPIIEAVANKKDSAMAPQARFLAGEAFIQMQEWPKAVERLQPFRDQDPWRNMPDLTDHALVRLGYAFAGAGNWDQSRQSFEAAVSRFAQSPYVDDARYGMALALQNAKNFDPAVNAYAEVAKHTAAEVGAKSQLQIGLCRLEQKRYDEAAQALLVVPFTYDYPEISAAAWCEAGRAYAEGKHNPEATKAFQHVLTDYPTSQWAAVAKKRMGELK